MRVILLHDVARVGRMGEVADAAEGYARNYLLPRGLAEPATSERLAALAKQHAQLTATAARAQESFSVLLRKVAEEPVVIRERANEQGRLFRGIHAPDIARALSARTGLALAPSSVALVEPIHTIGEHEVKLSLGDTEGTVRVVVEAV